jgi:hypothetical protein
LKAVLAGLAVVIILAGLIVFGLIRTYLTSSTPTDKEIEAAILALGMTTGAAIVCTRDEKHDRDIAFSYINKVVSIDRRRELMEAFNAGLGGGLAIRNDRNYPAGCVSEVPQALEKAAKVRRLIVQWTTR